MVVVLNVAERKLEVVMTEVDSEYHNTLLSMITNT